MEHINWYDSLGEVVEVLGELDERGKKDRQSCASQHDKWAGGSWDESMQWLQYGWKVDRDLIDGEVEKVMEQLSERLNTHWDAGFREVYDVAGGYVDVGRFLDGEPECMVEQFVEEAPKKGKVLRVLTNVSASSYINEDTIRQRGRAVAVAVEVLHMLGFNLELWAGEATTAGGDQCVEMVKVKEAHDPLDWDSVMFALAHPCMLRRVVFGLNEVRPMDVRKQFGFTGNGHYGSPSKFPKDIRDQYDVVLEALHSNDFNMREFVNQVMVTVDGDKVEEF